MRNLILFSTALSVTLSEGDVEQLGFEPTKEEFCDYFEIPADTEINEAKLTSEFKKSEQFDIADNLYYMNGEEQSAIKELGLNQQKKQPLKVAGKTVDTSATAEEKKAKNAAQKEEEKAKKLAEKAAEKEAKAAAKLAEKEAKKAEKKEAKPGVIASILNAITTAEKPISQKEIHAQLVALFPDKDPDSMFNTVKIQLSGKDSTRMEQEKGVKFDVTTEIVEEKAVKFYSLVVTEPATETQE